MISQKTLAVMIIAVTIMLDGITRRCLCAKVVLPGMLVLMHTRMTVMMTLAYAMPTNDDDARCRVARDPSQPPNSNGGHARAALRRDDVSPFACPFPRRANRCLQVFEITCYSAVSVCQGQSTSSSLNHERDYRLHNRVGSWARNDF